MLGGGWIGVCGTVEFTSSSFWFGWWGFVECISLLLL